MEERITGVTEQTGLLGCDPRCVLSKDLGENLEMMGAGGSSWWESSQGSIFSGK